MSTLTLPTQVTLTPSQAYHLKVALEDRVRTLNDALSNTSDVSYTWSVFIQEREQLFRIIEQLQG
jgi:hypothetical protein